MSVQDSSPNTPAEAYALDSIPIHLVEANGFNPRSSFEPAALAELAESIKQHGILEPLVVRPHSPAPIDPAKMAEAARRHGGDEGLRSLVRRDLEHVVKAGGRAYVHNVSFSYDREVYRDEGLKLGLDVQLGGPSGLGSSVLATARPLSELRYDLIAGERRLRAAKLAGLLTVPVRVVDVDDRTAHELALVENLVREDLDPIETAEGYRRLAELGVKQAEIGRRVGKSQPLVANTLRLLQLPADVQERIRKGELSTAHGVSLARFHEFQEVCSAIAESAVGSNLTSKGLDGEALPYAYLLEQKDLVRTVDSRYAFRETQCKACPFHAYRTRDNNGYWGWCLKPEHFDELKATEVAASQAEVKAAVAKLQSSTAAGGDGPLATEDCPVIERLEYGTYERLDRYTTPAGCKLAECPSYKRLIFQGGPTTLCMDPKCFKRLSIAQTKAQNKAKKQSIQERAKKLSLATKPLTEIGPREAAVIALYALSQTEADAIKEALKGKGLSDRALKKPYTGFDLARTNAMLDEYARLDPRDLLLAVLEALVQGEAKAELDTSYVYGRTNLHAGEWYVADPKPETAIVVASEPDVEIPRL